MQKRTVLIRSLTAVTITLSLTLLWSCTSRSPRPDEQTVRVATILGLTGENAAYGVKMRRGVELAADQINSTGGVNGKKLDLIIEDSQWDPKLGVSIYRKLHDVDGVRLYSAICGSTVALALCEAARTDDIVILDAISTAPKLTSYGGDKYFRICASEAHAGRNNVDWAIEDGMKNPLVVYVEDDWGTSYKDALISILTEKGFNAHAIPVAKQSRDLRAEAKKAVELKPDAVFLVVYASIAVPFVRQAKSYGLTATIYGGDNLSSADFVVAGKEAIQGVRVSIPGEPESAGFEEFKKKYLARFSEDPDVFALKSYDALMLLAHAAESGGPNPTSVVGYLRTMQPYQGASGAISFDKHGDLLRQAYRRMAYVDGDLRPWRK